MQDLLAEEIQSMGYKEDLQRVHDKIDHLRSGLNTAPVRPAANQWQIAAAVISAGAFGIALWTHFSTDVKNQASVEVSVQLKEPLKQIGEIAGELKGIKGQLEVLRPLISDTILKRMRHSENLSPSELKTTLEAARQQDVRIDPEVIKKTGISFLDKADHDPTAWNTALAFMDYRSFFNVADAPKLKDGKPDESFAQRFGSHIRTPQTGNADDAIRGQEAQRAQEALLFGNLVTDNFAVMERMEAPFNAAKGYQFIVYRISNHPEAELVLDGLHMRNVIVENTTVNYLGGPLLLENVYFVNCRFNFPSPAKNQAVDLAGNILSSPAITFKAA